jgi:hypothetical protein
VDPRKKNISLLLFAGRCLATIAVYLLALSNGSLLNDVITCFPVVV